MEWTIAFLLVARTLIIAGIIAGTGYVVFWLDHSGAWWLLAVFLIVLIGSGDISITRTGKSTST